MTLTGPLYLVPIQVKGPVWGIWCQCGMSTGTKDWQRFLYMPTLLLFIIDKSKNGGGNIVGCSSNKVLKYILFCDPTQAFVLCASQV